MPWGWRMSWDPYSSTSCKSPGDGTEGMWDLISLLANLQTLLSLIICMKVEVSPWNLLGQLDHLLQNLPVLTGAAAEPHSDGPAGQDALHSTISKFSEVYPAEEQSSPSMNICQFPCESRRQSIFAS